MRLDTSSTIVFDFSNCRRQKTIILGRDGTLRTGSGTGPPWGGQGSTGRNQLNRIRGKGGRHRTLPPLVVRLDSTSAFPETVHVIDSGSNHIHRCGLQPQLLQDTGETRTAVKPLVKPKTIRLGGDGTVHCPARAGGRQPLHPPSLIISLSLSLPPSPSLFSFSHTHSLMQCRAGQP